MTRIVPALVTVLGLGLAATAGNIDGRVAGWSTQSLSQRPTAVVWLDGAQVSAATRNEPVMAQRGGQFIPSLLVVVAGQTVSMPNEDEVAHNVYSVSPTKEFDLGYYAKGERKSVTFDRPGIVEVRCLLHSFMRGTILVVPNPYYSSVAADGSFHIRNVPAGSFVLNFWSAGMASYTEGVNVLSGNRQVVVEIPLPDAVPAK